MADKRRGDGDEQKRTIERERGLPSSSGGDYSSDSSENLEEPDFNETFNSDHAVSEMSFTCVWGGGFKCCGLVGADSLVTQLVKGKGEPGYEKTCKINNEIFMAHSGFRASSRTCAGILSRASAKPPEKSTMSMLMQALQADQDFTALMKADSVKSPKLKFLTKFLLVDKDLACSDNHEERDKCVCFAEYDSLTQLKKVTYSRINGSGTGYATARHKLHNLSWDSDFNLIISKIKEAFSDAARADPYTGGHVVIFWAEPGKGWKHFDTIEIPIPEHKAEENIQVDECSTTNPEVSVNAGGSSHTDTEWEDDRDDNDVSDDFSFQLRTSGEQHR